MQRPGQRWWQASPGKLAALGGILSFPVALLLLSQSRFMGLHWLIRIVEDGGHGWSVLLGAVLWGASAATVVYVAAAFVQRRLGPPRLSVRTLLLATAAVAVMIPVLLDLASLRPSGSNCGGNSAALHTVRQYWIFVQFAADDRPDRRFVIASATPQERADLARLTRSSWLGARFLVSTLPYRAGDSGPRRLLMVCDTPYSNIPYRLVPLAATHAAAFSDGSFALLSASEYAALDRSVLVPLDEVLAGPAPGSPLGVP